MTVFIILLALGACVVFPLYCALAVASCEDDRLENRNESPENRNDPTKGEDDRLEKWDNAPLERDTDGQKRDVPKKGVPENSKIRGGSFPLLRVMATKIAKINGV